MHKLLITLMFISLTGCASYNNSFECKPGQGVSCTSVSKINAMVDRGELNDTASSGKKIKKQTIRVKNKTPFPTILPNNFHDSVVERAPETTLRIWLAPYVSASDGYIEAQYIHEVLEPGAWVEQRR